MEIAAYWCFAIAAVAAVCLVILLFGGGAREENMSRSWPWRT